MSVRRGSVFQPAGLAKPQGVHCLASGAAQVIRGVHSRLKNGLLAIVDAGLTQVMNGFALCLIGSKRVYDGTRWKAVQRVSGQIGTASFKGIGLTLRLSHKVYKLQLLDLDHEKLAREVAEACDDPVLKRALLAAADQLAHTLHNVDRVFDKALAVFGERDGVAQVLKLDPEDFHAALQRCQDAQSLAAIGRASKEGTA